MTLAQYILVVSDNPWQALESPRQYGLALSADPSYQAWTDPAFLDAARRQGRPWIGSWADCHATPASEAIRLAAVHHLDGWMGEAESSGALQHALAFGAVMLVANPNAWTKEERDDVTGRILAGRLSVTAECYTNVQGPWPDTYSAQGVPTHSLCVGLYDGSADPPHTGRYVTVNEYLAHRFRTDGSDALAGMCAYVSGVHAGELARLPVASPPPPLPPPTAPPPAALTAAQVRARVADLAYAWEARNPGAKRSDRIPVLRRIARTKNTDAKWRRAAPKIAAALDEAGL